MAIGENIQEVIGALPADLVSRIEFLIVFIQAIGGIIVIYVIFSIARFFILRKEKKMIEEIRDDIKIIKKRIKPK